LTPDDLPPDLYERWEERVCIMHVHGQLPWPEAEALALADVLRQAEPVARIGKRSHAVQKSFFPAADRGPHA
jgi:hypothetical protein